MTDLEKAIRILEGNYKNFVLCHNGELITVNELIALLKEQERAIKYQSDRLERQDDLFCPHCGARMDGGEDE